MDQMPNKRSSKRRHNAEDNHYEVTEGPALKKQITSVEDGTLILEGKDSRKQVPVIDLDIEVVPKEFAFKEGGFPPFQHGTVYIQLDEFHKQYTFIFDKAVLARSSLFFAKALEGEVFEVDVVMAERLKRISKLEVIFELEYNSKRNAWLLARTVSPSTLIQLLMPWSTTC